MIVWLSSYPKSGNTYLRSLLGAYIYSHDGIFNFELLKKNFIQFPNKYIFERLGLKTKDQRVLNKNYLKAQEFINQLGKKNDIQFVKTHSSCASFQDEKFLSLKTTLGAIYVVRDPRNIVTSYSNHYQKSHEESVFDLTNDLTLGINSETHPPTYVGSWDFHYNSWKELKKINRYLLIKYEDLLRNPEDVLIEVLNFIYKLGNAKISIDLTKMKNVISSTQFKNMQKLEKEVGFDEAKINKVTGKKINFFNLGGENKWENILDNKLISKIESTFEIEMKELNYL